MLYFNTAMRVHHINIAVPLSGKNINLFHVKINLNLQVQCYEYETSRGTRGFGSKIHTIH